MTRPHAMALAHSANYRGLIRQVEQGAMEKPDDMDAIDAWTLLAELAEEIAGECAKEAKR